MGFGPTTPGAGPGAAATLACAPPRVALPRHCAPGGQQFGHASGAALTEDDAVSGGAAVCMADVCTVATGSGGSAGGGGECAGALHGLYRQLGFLYLEQSHSALYPVLNENPRSVYLRSRHHRLIRRNISLRERTCTSG